MFVSNFVRADRMKKHPVVPKHFMYIIKQNPRINSRRRSKNKRKKRDAKVANKNYKKKKNTEWHFTVRRRHWSHFILCPFTKCVDLNVLLFRHLILLFLFIHLYIYFFKLQWLPRMKANFRFIQDAKCFLLLLTSSSYFFASFDGMLTFRPLAILCPFLRLVWHSFKISSVESSEESKIKKEKKNKSIKTNTCAQHARYNVWPLKATIIKEKHINQWNVYFIAAGNEIEQNHFKKR